MLLVLEGIMMVLYQFLIATSNCVTRQLLATTMNSYFVLILPFTLQKFLQYKGVAG